MGKTSNSSGNMSLGKVVLVSAALASSVSAVTIGNTCVLQDVEKVDCGKFSTTQEQCEARGCCWQVANNDQEDKNTPFCYFRRTGIDDVIDAIQSVKENSEDGLDELAIDISNAFNDRNLLRGEIDALNRDIQGQLDGLRTDVAANNANLQGEIAGLRTDVAGNNADLQGQVAGLRTDAEDLRGDVATRFTDVNSKIVNNRDDINGIQSDTQTLKEEVDNTLNALTALESEIDQLQSKTSKSNRFFNIVNSFKFRFRRFF